MGNMIDLFLFSFFNCKRNFSNLFQKYFNYFIIIFSIIFEELQIFLKFQETVFSVIKY